jgi:hypothetical protein
VNIQDAAYNTVHDYRGGSESLAPRLGMSAAVLRNKVNPNNSTHHLTLAEADELMAKANDHRILHAMNAKHGFAVVEVGDEAGEGAATLLSAVLHANAAEGSFDARLEEALADGRISPRELSELTDLAIKQQAAMTRLVAKLAAVSASQRPELRAVG